MQVARSAEKIWTLASHLYASEPLGQTGRPGSGFPGSDVINIQVDHVSLDSTAVKVHP